MAAGGERKSSDFYAVLGLEKECTPTELRNAYKKLAMRWHPDRCSASGNSKFVEEAKKKFQAIQEAYSVLSDETKRFLYDVGVYDKDDDENNHGMGDFLNEMVTMMSEHKPTENGGESFEQLQELFEEMFQRDGPEAFTSASQGMSPSCSSPYIPLTQSSCLNNKRNSSEMNKAEASSSFNAHFQGFCVGDGLDHSWKIISSFWRSAGEIRERETEQPKEPEERVATVLEEDRVGNRRLHLAMTSPPTTMVGFPLEMYGCWSSFLGH